MQSYIPILFFAAIAALFPLLFGILHESSGGWQVPLLLLVAALVLSIPAGWAAGRRSTIEDDWDRRPA